MRAAGNWYATAWSLLTLAALGCGGSTGPKTVPVSGKVTVNGSEPFKGGMVRFLPKEGSKLSSREAKTDDNGDFEVMFTQRQRGLEPGEYTVMFSLWQTPDGAPLPDQTGEAYPKEPAELGGVQWVPTDYVSGKAAACTVTISDQGEKLEFDLPELKPQKSSAKRRG